MEFQALVLRCWKGLFFGADPKTIREQLKYEGESEERIENALVKALESLNRTFGKESRP